MMIPKLLTSTNAPMARSRGLRVLCSVILLGTTVACSDSTDAVDDEPRSRTERNQPGDDDDSTATRKPAADDDGPNTGGDDDDEDLSIGSNEEVDQDLSIGGGRTRAGGGGGGRSRTNTTDEITSDAGLADAGDAGDVDVDVDAGEVEVDVDAGVEEVVDAGDAGVSQ